MNFSVNDIVRCHGVEYLVLKVNPVKLKCRKLSTGETWNIPKAVAVFDRKAEQNEKITQFPLFETELKLGSLVRFKNNPKVGNTLFTIVGMASAGLRVAKLGGDNNRYWKGLTADQLVLVDPSDVLK